MLMTFLFAAAVKNAVGGETASQNDVMEAAIKKWFRSQEDAIKVQLKKDLMKKQELAAERMAAALATAKAAEQANANEAASGNVTASAAEVPVLKMSMAEARAMAAGDVSSTDK